MKVEHSMLNAERSTSNGEQTEYHLEKRLLEFSTRGIRLADSLQGSLSASHVAKRLLRSSTSPDANHDEVEAAESRADFNHKISICLKELRETIRWLKLIQKVPLVRKPDLVETLIQENEEPIRIFYSSLRTSKKKVDK